MNLNDITAYVAIVEFFLAIAGPFAVYIVLRGASAKASDEIEEKVRATLMDENSILRNRIVRLEADYSRCNSMIQLIIDTFKRRGTIISTDNDLLMIQDTKEGTIITVRNKKEEQ